MNEQFDKLMIANEKLLREVENMGLRVKKQDEFIKGILDTLTNSEELFELRVSQVIYSFLDNITHGLKHGIESAQDEVRRKKQGFEILVVDGKEVKEGPSTIIVTKTEAGYDYATAADPTTILNENTQTFSDYFNANPEIFGERKELLVNIQVVGLGLGQPPAEK